MNEYYEFSKTVVASSFHFADGKEISTGYSLEDAYQEGAVALCTAALHFNADKGVSFKTYAAAVIRNHLKKVMFTKKIAEYPLESIDDSPMFSYEMESSVEYCEMVDFIRHSSNAKDKGRSLLSVISDSDRQGFPSSAHDCNRGQISSKKIRSIQTTERSSRRFLPFISYEQGTGFVGIKI